MIPLTWNCISITFLTSGCLLLGHYTSREQIQELQNFVDSQNRLVVSLQSIAPVEDAGRGRC